MPAHIRRSTGHTDLPSLIAPASPHIEAIVEVTEPQYFIQASPPPITYNASLVDVVSPRPQRLISDPSFRSFLDGIEDTEETRAVNEYVARLMRRVPSSRFGRSGEYVGVIWMEEDAIAGPPPNSPVPLSAPAWEVPGVLRRLTEVVNVAASRGSYRSQIPTVTVDDGTQDLSPIPHPLDGTIIFVNPAMMHPAPVASPMPSSHGSEAPGAPFPANRVASPSSFGYSSGSESVDSRDYSIPSSQNGLGVTIPMEGHCESPTSPAARFEMIKARSRGSQDDVKTTVGSWVSQVPSLCSSDTTGETISGLPTVGNSPHMSTDHFDIGQQDIWQKDKDEMPHAGIKFQARVGEWVYTAIGGLKALGFRAKASAKDPAGIV